MKMFTLTDLGVAPACVGSVGLRCVRAAALGIADAAAA